MKRMSNISRILIAIGSLALIPVLFLPVWFIYLTAPQYPEGLTMYIWLDKITGEVEIINGLNHYIGMKHIKAEMFPEFGYLKYIMAAFIALGLIVAAVGRKIFLVILVLLSFAGGVAAMVDFYKWGYDYGHNLDPTAAIQIPGFSYQPPLFGHKQVLNFDAYSYPDTGGWILIGSVLLFCAVLVYEWRKSSRSTASLSKMKTGSAIAAMMVLFTACSAKEQPINYGKDQCDECRMTIMDNKYSAELLTKKGRVYKFDDAICVANFLKNKKVEMPNVHKILFSAYDTPGSFVVVKDAVFVVGSKIKTPMNSHAAAFRDKAAADKMAAEIEGKVTEWPGLYIILSQ